MRLPIARWALVVGMALGGACDAADDGLCYPPECRDDEQCGAEAICVHAACVMLCNDAGGCPGLSECRTDNAEGVTFCADSDGLPVVPCDGPTVG